MIGFIGVDEVIQARPLPDGRLMLQVVAGHIEIFLQIVSPGKMHFWTQKRREWRTGGPAVIKVERLLKTHWQCQQAERKCCVPGETGKTFLQPTYERDNGKACQGCKK